MVDTVLRLPDEIAKALKEDAAKNKLSANTLIVKVLAERYDIPYEFAENRRPEKYFKKGEIHGIIKEILTGRQSAVSSRDIVNRVIELKGFEDHPELPKIRVSISSILGGLCNRGTIKKTGRDGMYNLWKLV